MFIVTKRFGRSETRLSDFSKEADAKKFIQKKLQEDVLFKLTAIYGLYEGADLIQEFTQKDIVQQASHSGSSDESDADSGSSGGGSSGQGAGSRSSFAPTPFNTAPRPTGIPHSWVKDEPDEDDNKK